MDPENLTEFIKSITTNYKEFTEEQVSLVKQFVGENIMSLESGQTDRLMRCVRTLEKVIGDVEHMIHGQDVDTSSWKRRILMCARDCGGKMTTDRLREWMQDNVTFTDHESQEMNYQSEKVVRWWHSMRPNLTHMVKDGTLTREKHGTYSITNLGLEYLES